MITHLASLFLLLPIFALGGAQCPHGFPVQVFAMFPIDIEIEAETTMLLLLSMMA